MVYLHASRNAMAVAFVLSPAKDTEVRHREQAEIYGCGPEMLRPVKRSHAPWYRCHSAIHARLLRQHLAHEHHELANALAPHARALINMNVVYRHDQHIMLNLVPVVYKGQDFPVRNLPRLGLLFACRRRPCHIGRFGCLLRGRR